LTAFQLSDELKRLARAESQFREEYIKLRTQVQQFVSGLVDQAREWENLQRNDIPQYFNIIFDVRITKLYTIVRVSCKS
jgi:hypothetical protein